MCEYCEKGKELIERNKLGRATCCYVGIGIDISGNLLNIEACEEVGYPSLDSTYIEETIQINYCPMCR